MSKQAWNEMSVSPSKLGSLAAPDYCPLCYWRLQRLKFKKPFNFPMPGILNNLDGQHKQLVSVLLDREGKLPEYFGAFCSATEVLPIDAVEGFHSETNLDLRGKPDLVLRDAKGKVMVVDNKTAKIKPATHPLSARYAAQINMYGFLLERCPDAHEVTRVALLYYEFSPLTDDEILPNIGKDFMFARFTPQLVEIDYDPEAIVVPLLEKYRELLDMNNPPDGNENCPDCPILDEFHDCTKMTDAVRLPIRNDTADYRRYLSESYLKRFGIDDKRQAKLDGLWRDAQPDGVLAHWFDDGNAM
jgi:hypothetical protein